MTARAVLAVAFLGCVVAANWLTERYGFVSVGFGQSATAGTFAAGATFTIRDAIQDRWGRLPVVVLIGVGAALSAVVSPALALASGVAFLVAETADLLVYSPLRSRSWDAAVWLSAAVGAAVDTALFLGLAFGWSTVTVGAMVGQLIGKGWATLVAWAVVRWAR